MFRVLTFKGRYCRDCAELTFRRTTRHTLLTGWWGVAALFANMYILVANLLMYRRVRSLGRPKE